MTFNANLKSFHGLTVRDYKPGDALPDLAATAVRLRLDWDDYDQGKMLDTYLDALLAEPGADQLAALVIGSWGGAAGGDSIGWLIEKVAASSGKLPNLRALFVGDLTFEECEVSWIVLDDLSPLWSAYPGLVEFGVRCGGGFSLGDEINLPQLKKLVIESGGLPPDIVKQVAQANLPGLEHLELWLGTSEYGGDTTVEQLLPILNGGRLPNVRYLGLRNAEITNDIAKVIGGAAITPQLEVLDLSKGTLHDAGANALASGGGLDHLTKLDVHHHYMTDAGINALRGLGVALDASDPQEADGDGDDAYYYVAVSE